MVLWTVCVLAVTNGRSLGCYYIVHDKIIPMPCRGAHLAACIWQGGGVFIEDGEVIFISCNIYNNIASDVSARVVNHACEALQCLIIVLAVISCFVRIPLCVSGSKSFVLHKR